VFKRKYGEAELRDPANQISPRSMTVRPACVCVCLCVDTGHWLLKTVVCGCIIAPTLT